MRIRLRTEPRTRAKRKRDNGPEGQRGYNDKEGPGAGEQGQSVAAKKDDEF